MKFSEMEVTTNPFIPTNHQFWLRNVRLCEFSIIYPNTGMGKEPAHAELIGKILIPQDPVITKLRNAWELGTSTKKL